MILGLRFFFRYIRNRVKGNKMDFDFQVLVGVGFFEGFYFEWGQLLGRQGKGREVSIQVYSFVLWFAVFYDMWELGWRGFFFEGLGYILGKFVVFIFDLLIRQNCRWLTVLQEWFQVFFKGRFFQVLGIVFGESLLCSKVILGFDSYIFIVFVVFLEGTSSFVEYSELVIFFFSDWFYGVWVLGKGFGV